MYNYTQFMYKVRIGLTISEREMGETGWESGIEGERERVRWKKRERVRWKKRERV